MAENVAVVPGVSAPDQRRLAVVCRTTRVDVSLPAHVELVTIVPELVDLVRGHLRSSSGPGTPVDVDERMGSSSGGAWQLSRLSGETLSASESLAQQRVHDGEILVLDRRPVPTPPPLFDDVLQGLTDPRVTRLLEWDRRDALGLAVAIVALSGVIAEAAVLLQWWGSGGLTPVLAAAGLALLAVTAAPVVRILDAPAPAGVTSVLAVVVATPVAVTVAVPGAPSVQHALVAGSVAAVVSTGLRSLLRLSPGGRPGPRGSLSALLLGFSLASGVAAVLSGARVVAPELSAAGAGAAAAVVGLVGLTLAPHIAVSTSRMPVPPVPAPGEEVADRVVDHDVVQRGGDGGPDAPRLPTPAVLRRGAEAARVTLAGLLGGFGTAVAGGAMISLLAPSDHPRWAGALSVALVVVLVLRGLAYSDRAHAGILLVLATGLALGILAGVLFTSPSPVAGVVPVAVGLAVAAVVLGVVVPRLTLSPGIRATVSAVEAIAICAAVPLAVGVTGLYELVRHR